MRRLSDSKLDQSEDTELGTEQLSIFETNSAILFKQCIEFLHKGRIEGEERRIEGLVEILELCIELVTAEVFLQLVKIA